MDKLRATGAGREPADSLNVAELCLLEILGHDSAVMKGIDPENEIAATETTMGSSRLVSFLKYKNVGKDIKNRGNPKAKSKL